MKNKVTTKDHGAKALMRRLEGSGEVTVGIHAAEGAKPKEGGDEEGMALIDVAIIHEFGATIQRELKDGGTVEIVIPERSFIRAWEDENRDRHNDEMRRMAKAVIAGKIDMETALRQLGVRRQGEVQMRIAAGIEPPNAASTIARKGSSKPLIDSGQLRSAVSHETSVKK